MIPARVYHYRDPAAVVLGLEELSARGLTARGLLFVALDNYGDTYLAVPDDFDSVSRVRVGDKLTLKPPWEGRYFHFDSVFVLPGKTVLWNGDRRLDTAGSASEVACVIAMWLAGHGQRNVFLGCTPHQPGAWWTADERAPVTALHGRGFVDATVTASGIIARRIGEPALYFLSFAELRERGVGGAFSPVYISDLGNILMVERRILNYSVVLTCAGGLVELDVSGLPESTTETARVEIESGLGVVGRIDGGAFAITAGTPVPWGLDAVSPAVLIGSRNQTLHDLPKALDQAPADTLPGP